MWVYITIVFTYLTIARLFLLNVILYFNFLKLIANIYGNCGIISLKVTLFFTFNFILTVLLFKYKIGLPHFVKLCDISNEPFVHFSSNRHLISVGNICFHFNKILTRISLLQLLLTLLTVTLLIAHGYLCTVRVVWVAIIGFDFLLLCLLSL